MWGRRERMAHRAAHLANTAYYQGLRARVRHGMQRFGATGVVKMHTAPNRFEIFVREALILGVCLCAAATLVLAVELRDRGSDWAMLAFFAQCGLFVLAGYIGYAVDRRGPLPRAIDFTKRYGELRLTPSAENTTMLRVGGWPMATAKRGGIRWGDLPRCICTGPHDPVVERSGCVWTEPPSASLTPPPIDPSDPIAQAQQHLTLAGEIVSRERIIAEGDETTPEDFDRWAYLGDARAGVSDALYHLGKITEVVHGAPEACGCRLPTRDVHRGRTDLIDRSGCTEGHHAW